MNPNNIVNTIFHSGETVIVQAARVLKEFLGFGISRDARKVSINELRKKYNLKQEVWTSINQQVHDGILNRHQNISLIVLRVCIYHIWLICG